MLHLYTGLAGYIRLLALSLLIAFACSLMLVSCSSHTTKARKKVDKQMERELKRSEKAYKQDVKRHQKIQSDNTRKMMKQTRRQSKKYNKKKIREPFGLAPCRKEEIVLLQDGGSRNSTLEYL